MNELKLAASSPGKLESLGPEECTAEFKPVVHLTEEVNTQTLEQQEECLWKNRSKLYRFIDETNEWKERGIGDIKFLRNKDTNKVRILLRQEKTLKVFMNHQVHPDIDLKPHPSCETMHMWTTDDFAEDVSGVRQTFAAKFKSTEIASDFKKIWNEVRDHNSGKKQLTKKEKIIGKEKEIKPTEETKAYQIATDFKKKWNDFIDPNTMLKNDGGKKDILNDGGKKDILNDGGKKEVTFEPFKQPFAFGDINTGKLGKDDGQFKQPFVFGKKEGEDDKPFVFGQGEKKWNDFTDPNLLLKGQGGKKEDINIKGGKKEDINIKGKDDKEKEKPKVKEEKTEKTDEEKEKAALEKKAKKKLKKQQKKLQQKQQMEDKTVTISEKTTSEKEQEPQIKSPQVQHSQPKEVKTPKSDDNVSDKVDKKAKKKARQEKKQQQQQSTLDIPIIKNAADFNAFSWGDYKIIQSQFTSNREFTLIKNLVSKANGNVWIRARVQTIRAKGKLAFLVLRDGFHTVQAVLFAEGANSIDKDAIKFVAKMEPESIVDIFGFVNKFEENKIQAATQRNIEISVKKIFCLSHASQVLPFQFADACRREGVEDSNQNSSEIRVTQDIRLDHRVLDLRTPAQQAIVRITSAVCKYFREYLDKKSFVEVHTPKLISGASEGGAAVFKLKYFDQQACLAQSPQLYKQMCICSDLHCVYEIGPVFRAEDSNTNRHLCEFTGLDLEMEIKEHYTEVLDVVGKALIYIFKNLNKFQKTEISVIHQQYPAEPLKFKEPVLVLHFPDAVKLLRENGVEISDYDDLSIEQERKLGEIIKKKYDTDFYILDKYPLAARPFYTMPHPEDNKYSNSYDVFVRGEEIISGAQRIHDHKLLTQRAKEFGIPESSIQGYLDSFKYGAFPHGGAGVGLERLVMLFLGLNNIRKVSLFPRDPKRCKP